MPTGPSDARPRSHWSIRATRRGWAFARSAVLVLLVGLLIALVVATIFGGIVIAINGKLP
jgi:hypothetical protein